MTGDCKRKGLGRPAAEGESPVGVQRVCHRVS